MKRLITVLSLSFALMLISVVSIPKTALAAVAAGCDKSSSFLGLPTWYKYLEVGEETRTVVNDAGVSVTVVVDKCAVNGPKGADGKLDPKAVIARVALAVIEILLRLGGLVAVFFAVYGGFKYITSQGEPEKTKNARYTIINAMIGLFIAIIATGAVAFIGRAFTT